MPTDVNLMGILKETVLSEQVLWGHLQFTDSITLNKMLEVIFKWKSKTSQQSDSAVDNYSALSGNLRRPTVKSNVLAAEAEDQVARGVETRACLACKKVGRLVKDCRHKAAKDAWLAKREKK